MAVNQQVKISNAAIHVNGVAVLGGPNEVTIEGIKAKTADSMSLGMQGTVEYTTGVEKMSMTVKLNHVDAQVASMFGDIYTPKQIQVRCLHETNGPSGRTLAALVYKLNATSKSPFPGLSLKAQEKAEFEIEMSISGITVELDNVEIFHFDALGNTHRVNGVSVLANANALLGI